MKFKIRTRITFWSSLLFLILLLLLSIFLHYRLKYYLLLALEDYSFHELKEISQILIRGCTLSELQQFYNNEIQLHSKDFKLDIHLRDSQGKTLFEPRFKDSVSLLFPIENFNDKKFTSVVFTETPKAFVSSCIVQGRILSSENQSPAPALQEYYLQVMFPLESINHILISHRHNIYIAVALLLTITIPVGWFIAARAIAPVYQIAYKTEQITEKNLNEQRLPIRGTHDELDHLALMLNKMLDRVSSSVNRIQRFTSDASHEIRTPLTTIRGELELLYLYPHRFKGISLAPILEEIDSLNIICNRLLFLSNLDERFLPEKQEFSLFELLKKTIEQVRPLAELQHICLSFESQNDIFIFANPKMISQVILNLVENAFKYTDLGGSITLKLEKEENWAKILVQDTGIGISQEHLPFIFDRFYRIRNTDSSQKTGSGLGLAIVKEVVECHGGSIHVFSQLHQGSTFEVKLPLPPSSIASLQEKA
jgi:signal transduction histidine kinase